MADPPSYEESTSGICAASDEKSDRKTPQSWSIREQIGLSRSQHVASIVSQVVGHIRQRALRGLSKTTLLLVPSDQDASQKGDFVGFSTDDMPALIQFEGRQNSMQFWSQDEALAELKVQLRDIVSDGMPAETGQERQEKTVLPPTRKTSWFGRKPSKAAVPTREPQPAACLVKVNVQLDEIYFRSETEYGLYETSRAQVIGVTVQI